MKSTSGSSSLKFPRREPEADLARAEEGLFEEMERAAELLQSEGDFGRSGARHALHSCYSFLHVRGLSGQALKPLIDLIAALEDVDRGTLPELFDPKLRAGQSPARKWSRSALARQTKIYAAACMDALMQQGVPKNEAAKRVARFAIEWPRVAGGDLKSSTVAKWRDELLQSPSTAADRLLFEGIAKILSQGARAKAYLDEVLHSGPVMTGGVRKKRKSET